MTAKRGWIATRNPTLTIKNEVTLVSAQKAKPRRHGRRSQILETKKVAIVNSLPTYRKQRVRKTAVVISATYNLPMHLEQWAVR